MILLVLQADLHENPIKKETYISYGKSLKALGYIRLYSAGRIGLLSLKNPKGAIYMLQGYTSNDIDLYEEDLRSFLRYIQYIKLKQYIKSFLFRYSKST